MMKQNNPFPGMNPWLQNHWSDVHTKLIAYIADALSPELPSALSARAEEHIALESEDEVDTYRADVAVADDAHLVAHV